MAEQKKMVAAQIKKEGLDLNVNINGDGKQQ